MSTPSITEATTSAPNIQSLHPGFSIAGRRRRTLRFAAVTIALALTAAALWVAMILVGETWYSPDEVLAVLSGDIVPGASFDVGEIRLPRAIIGLLAGMAFGMAGTTSQTMLRNQLASPDIIGITSGASASAVFAILVLGWSPAGIGVNILAIACGLGTALTIFLLSGQGRSQGGRLILIGIGVSAMFTSLISYLQLQGNVYKAIEAMRWLSGSLDSVSWNQVPVLAAAMAVCGALLLVIGRDLGPLTLGEETATGLGVPVDRARLALVITMVALSAFATAATGPIAFVSFLAGPMAARLIGQTDRSLLVPAALMGAVIVLGCDLVAQCFLSAALPVGVVTGLMGAPYLDSLNIGVYSHGASASPPQRTPPHPRSPSSLHRACVPDTVGTSSSTAWTRRSPAAESPSSWGQTPVGSQRFSRPWPGSWRRRRARSCSTASPSTRSPPEGWQRDSVCYPSSRSHLRGSLWPTSWGVGATHTSPCSAPRAPRTVGS